MANGKRLIDANALLEDAEMDGAVYANLAGMSDVRFLVDSQPTVDAEPVVHGHWVKYNFLGHEQFACSECQTLGSPQWKRCPVCEAKMDGERKDNENP